MVYVGRCDCYENIKIKLPSSYITFSAEQISQMPFYYVQDVYHKNQLGT